MICATLTQKSLREQIGLVTQETFLFHDTIFSNIQFGRLMRPGKKFSRRRGRRSRTISSWRSRRVTRRSSATKAVCSPAGSNSGWRSRARLLKNAPILLLDEATSSLDSESEKQIQLALETLSAGRTVIAIAHRLSTILSADQIVVMEQGHIKEIGTHSELLEKSGYYRRLYDMQFNRDPEDAPVPAEEPDFLVESLA